MWNDGTSRYKLLAVGVLAALVATPAFSAGFGIFEHGSKAMGMAGAFTAQADDPSAMFHNAGGLAFQKERAFQVGTTLISNTTADFDGLAPFPGPDAEGQQKDAIFFPSHAYWVEPLGPGWTFGLGFNNPFGLVLEWDNPNTWPGRYISYRAELRTFDLNPTLAWQATPNFGIGFGVVGRWSDIELNRRIPFLNPFTQQVQDVGDATLESDLDEGFGWNVGILHKATDRFSWGLSYRSKIEIDYGGDGRFTQIPTGIPALDGAIAASLPFDQNLPLETTIEFPDLASLGLAYRISRNLLVETDFNWAGWSSFDELPITFTQNPEFSDVVREDYEDSYNYRLGINWTTSPSSQWRFGYVYDETPQPEESVGPLLPDANRNGVTVGYGYSGGWDFDIALMYLKFEERTRDESFPNDAIYHGVYDTTGFLLGMTLGF
ncbi:MAG: outer membrane protein transport protein [Acidobacteriota bacterium]|jgi:long-chain fatty acid transport protein